MPVTSEAVIWRSGAPLDPQAPMELAGLIDQAIRRAGNAVVLREGDRSLTWKDLDAWSARLAGAWAGLIPRGGRIGLVLHNGFAHLLGELAAWRLNAIAVPVSMGLGSARIQGLLSVSRVALVISDDPAAVPSGVAHLNSSALIALAQSSGVTTLRAAHPDDPCLILMTSGSTGMPRRVLLSHRNLCSQQAAFAAIWPDIGPGDRLASYLPWHHSFGGLAERLWALCRGACMTLVPGGGRDHARFIACVREVRPTVFMSVPKMHRVAVQADAFDLATVKWVFSAGAVLSAAEERWYAERRVRVCEGWGLTESSPSATITPLQDQRVPGVVGRPIPGVSVGVRGDGRLLIAGPGVMLGYDGDPEASAAILHTDPLYGRVLDSGDEGRWTDAGLRLDGRVDHVAKLLNGEKVPLPLLASRLEGQSGIRAALVFVREGERLGAILAVQPDASDDELIAAVHAANRMEPLPYLRIVDVWRLSSDPSVDNGLLTGSMKIAGLAWQAALASGGARQLIMR